MSQLDRKLLRDLWAMRGQVVTIALVIGAGVAVFIASISTFDSLRASRDRFYSATRFPQIFVTLKRAPRSIVARISAIPGVVAVEPRVAGDVIVDRPESVLPVSARLVSIDNAGEGLSRLHLRRGAPPFPGDVKSAAINEAFAESNGLALGESLRVLLNGRVQSFRITGIALSPEYVYAVKPGLPIPDDRLYAILWVDRRAAEAAFDMKGAFNDLVVFLAPGTDPRAVMDVLDRLLAPYGSVGAIERRDQPSNRFLEDELNQQKVMSVTVPFIFFGVAAFLLNVTLGRLVSAQREQIAALKALGFPAFPIAVHYLKLVAVVVFAGSLVGIGGGWAFGQAMMLSYRDFFRLPELAFALTPWSIVFGIAASFAIAAFGVLSALRNVMILPPAVAMRPPVPGRYRHSPFEGLIRVKPRHLMVFRNIAGRPLRSALTIIGIAFAIPMVVLGLFWRDAIDSMIDIQFHRVERGNVALTFPHPLSENIVGDLAREPGVLAVEGQRFVPVRLRAGHRSYLTSVIGLPERSELRRPHDTALRPVEMPAEGITLTRRLAERLGVSSGDTITVEVMEGRRRTRALAVNASIDETIGMAAYMRLDALNLLTGEGAVVSAAALYVDPSSLPNLARRLKELPVVQSVAMKADTLNSFMDKVAALVLVSAGILTGFGVIIAVGVVYNSARIGLQERAWELASLRVLGFSRAEVARILFGEFALEISLGIPMGLALSKLIIDALARFHSNESFQIPGVIGARTYAIAALIVAAAALGSAFVVRRQIDRLDLVSALKARE